MGYIPKCPVAPCPNCGEFPSVKIGWRKAQLVCDCGVSGAKVKLRGYTIPYNEAINGWIPVAGTFMDFAGPPPKPTPTLPVGGSSSGR